MNQRILVVQDWESLGTMYQWIIIILEWENNFNINEKWDYSRLIIKD